MTVVPNNLCKLNQDEFLIFALDIGGTLIKMIKIDHNNQMKFFTFSIKSIENVIEEVKNFYFLEFNATKTTKSPLLLLLLMTGGGSVKYLNWIKNALPKEAVIKIYDEILSVSLGCRFLLNFEIENFVSVNVGTGISLIHCMPNNEFLRVSGSCLGGGSLLGLAKLILRKEIEFYELVKMAHDFWCKGDSKESFDMTVADIYGPDSLVSLGLSAELIASSFGKVETPDFNFSDEILSSAILSLFKMICSNISLMAFQTAALCSVKTVVFCGSFVGDEKLIQFFIKNYFQYYSKNSIDCLFVKNQGFAGAIGTVQAFGKKFSTARIA